MASGEESIPPILRMQRLLHTVVVRKKTGRQAGDSLHTRPHPSVWLIVCALQSIPQESGFAITLWPKEGHINQHIQTTFSDPDLVYTTCHYFLCVTLVSRKYVCRPCLNGYR